MNDLVEQQHRELVCALSEEVCMFFMVRARCGAFT
jgi:hypothetical protein